MGTSTELQKISVALSSENEFRRLGFEQLLKRIAVIDSFTIYRNAAELVANVRTDTDVIIIPIKELDEAPSLFIPRLPRRSRTLLLLNGVPDECVSYIAAAPAHGFLSEHELCAETLSLTLQRMVAGDVPMPHELTKKLLKLASEPHNNGPGQAPIHLTPREQEVLVLLVEGLSNKQIASRLTLSQHSIKRLVTNILAKLNSPNRTSAVAKAINEGLVYQTATPTSHHIAS
ncbi:helix-turn-helix transcriptional regulator [Nonomuraea angiospora]|uniref:helix-turn-helix transcriptional regulator n=1 Tax=Nonomuraea angiospora TaxID=46172 RepID=UPI0029BC4BA1|nr:response regulator transcription factor [Nonomuraea angiospora]MDX3106694.1 response regulator transcription factor [Nonomuraea angiospora]